MLTAFCSLTTKEKRCVKLHITGTSLDNLKRKINSDELYLQIANVFVVHEWMEYTELIDLYRTIDFLILIRFDNQITQANFPSKIPESMSFGIIPVCTRVGDYTKYYLKDNFDSIIFDPDSTKICLDSIRKAIYMPESQYLLMRNNARRTAVEKFGFKNWSEKLHTFILSK